MLLRRGCPAFPVQPKGERKLRKSRGRVGWGRKGRREEEQGGRQNRERTILRTTILTFEKNYA